MSIDIEFDFEVIDFGTTLKLYWEKLAEDLNVTELRLASDLRNYLLEREAILLNSQIERCTYITGDIDTILILIADFIWLKYFESVW